MGVWLFRNSEEIERGKSILLQLVKEKEESSQGASMSSPSTFSTQRWKYEVFLSFCGVDTRRGFTDHIYAALKRKGILTFRDDEELERGKPISPELLKAIEESRIAIIIFSRNYAFSTWCLDELAKIVRCMRETGLMVWPVFYDVDPSNVRKQTGTFGEAFSEHEKCFTENIKKVEIWRDALREVANLSGWHLQDWHESEFIEHIVEEMMEKLSSKSSSITKNFIGIESMVAKLIPSYLGFKNNVCMIGIYGMGGIGKTTLARVVYDEFRSHFEGSSFIANVREDSKRHGLHRLQEQLLADILEDKNIDIRNVYKGVDMIKKRICQRKVLLVIDDVNQLDQLEKMAGEQDWFGLGSWIIITTRDEHVLVQHGVLKRYKPELLNNDDASKLFCLKAFKMEQPKEGYMQLSHKVVEYANGLPLALVTLGSFLVGRTTDEWKSALDSFKKTKGEIFDILKISYDGLEEMWKEIFLDIACFFRGWAKDEVIQILESCGFDARIGISVLLEKSLLTIDDNEFLGMHDLLAEMGEKIIHLESGGKLGKQSRLWLIEDVLCVLENDMASEAIQAIALYGKGDFKFEEFPEVFSKMSNLRLLIIDDLHIPKIPNALNFAPNNLKHLSWNLNSSLKCLPSSFQPKELVQLNLRCSEFEYLWEGVKHLGKLKFIDLSSSVNLIRTPDFSGVPGLVELKLFVSYCYSSI
nr:TMV resistance protein N-like [Quercus suber]